MAKKKQHALDPSETSQRVKHLYTPSETKEARRVLFAKQQGIDPILKEKIKWEDSALDHDHRSQHCRAALHRQTNAFEGLVFNAYKRCLSWVSKKELPEILRNLADYLEQDYSGNPYHSDWIKKVHTLFNTLTEPQKKLFLANLGGEMGVNSKERKAILQALILTRDLDYDILTKHIQQLKSIQEL